MAGTFGYELNLGKLSEEEKEELYKIFNNMLSRTTDIYEYGEEIDINAYY